MLAVLLALAHGGDTVAQYWQQQVAYVISAALDEPSGVLTGQVRIRYVNRSPDTLRDFYVHQYLNAFRPGSRWAAADSAEGRVRFQHLAGPDYAFERITRATVMGQAIAPDYPYAPDSTVAHWTLPWPLAPGDSMTVEIEWRRAASASASTPSRCITSRSRSTRSTCTSKAATATWSYGCCTCQETALPGAAGSRWAGPSPRSLGSTRCTARSPGRS